MSSFFGLIGRRIAAVMDAHARAIVAASVNRTEPKANWVCGRSSRAFRDAKSGPTHVITDRGLRFTSGAFRRLLRRRRIRHRYGAVGRHGSFALIERFWRKPERECLDATSAWLATRAFAAKVERYAHWHNVDRPHQGLRGRTPGKASSPPPPPLAVSRRDVIVVTRRDLLGDPRLPICALRVRKTA